MAGKLTYRQAGVDTRGAAALATRIGGLARRTHRRHQLHQAFGLFAAAFDLSGWREPVIVTGCDGVGTKLDLLLARDLLETAGRDLVAMNVNDVLTTGGDPLLFLDYIGLARLEPARIERLIAGMVAHLEVCGCILAGGETAEMPGLVPEGVFELAGFCIGCAEKAELIDPSAVRAGDCVVGYPSDGPHANGWSLVRRILRERPGLVREDDLLGWLVPTRLYHDVVGDLKAGGVRARAYAHITGGGLPENLGRVLPDGCGADLELPRWSLPGIDALLAEVEPDDLPHTFNLGIGWVAIVAPGDLSAALAAGPGGRELGRVAPGSGVRVRIRGD
jgi:phosphoribosylformylglycinamidine cyclo-ligase